MTRPLIIQGWEHKVDFTTQEKFDCQKYLGQCIANHKGSERKILGLRKKSDGFAPGNYIGMVWLDEDDNRVLRVDSKFPTMDYIAMYAKCMSDSQTGERTANCLKFWTEQKLIDTTGNEFSVLVIIAYLRELNELCRRHMRRHFISERQNFVGKMKGKIIVGENIRRNTTRARPDRIYCEYQSVSDDILENQILRTALERASRYFTEYSGNKNKLDMLPQWIRASRAALHDVSTRHVKPGDFIAARKRGTFAFYKRPLNLAKAILQYFGPNPKAEISQTQTPPFALNSAELFERYVEIQLRKNFSKVERGINTDSPNAGAFNVKIRPDFYASHNQTPWIIDAKYKDINLAYREINDNNKKTKPPHSDIYQVIAYSQHRGLLDKMGCEHDSVKLGLAYPSVIQKNIRDDQISHAFHSDIVIYEIPCPTKHNEDN